MLDSDSDFEYSAGANESDASSDTELRGRIAFGIDPQEAKVYDGKSTPMNGSQYLMMVMKEKKSTPKIACADSSKLPQKKFEMLGKGGTGGEGAVGNRYLEEFLQRCSVFEEEQRNGGESDTLPSTKWREDIVSNFSIIRTRVERWQYRIGSNELRIDYAPKFPESNDNAHWLKFCFGQAFLKLAALQKMKTAEEKLADFFLDLYDESLSQEVLDDLRSTDDLGSEPKEVKAEDTVEGAVGGVGDGDGETLTVESDSVADEDGGGSSGAKKVPESSGNQVILGQRPTMSILMRLTQTQLENLIKWNLLWLNNIGFINECQGQWIYALLSCIPKPIDPSVMSDLRGIARALIKIRGAEHWTKMLEQSKCTDEKLFDFINSLNLLVYVIADYFQQKDLIMKL